MRALFRIFLFIVSLLLSQLPFDAYASAQTKLAVTVSIPPLKYFVERIGEEDVNVTVMAGKGQDPHTYEPTASQMTSISGTELYFAIGVPFETQWLPKFRSLNPAMRVISLLDAVDRIKNKPDPALRHTLPGKRRHHHNDEYRHGLDTDDPHVWMSTVNMLRIIPLIADALGGKKPELKETIDKRAEALRKDITALDTRIRELFTPLDGWPFLTFHQSWAYYARDFKLREVSVELDGREPGPKSMAMLINFAMDNKINVVVADPMTSRSDVDAITRSISAVAVIANPMEENWPEAMLEFSQKLALAMQGHY